MRGLADQLANLILIANFLCWVEEGRLLERGPLAAEIKRRIVNAFFRQTVAALWWEMPTRRTALQSRANEPWPQTQKYWERAPSSPLQYDAAVRPVVIKMGNTGRHFPRLPAAIYDPSTTRLQKKRKLWAVGFFVSWFSLPFGRRSLSHTTVKSPSLTAIRSCYRCCWDLTFAWDLLLQMMMSLGNEFISRILWSDEWGGSWSLFKITRLFSLRF